MGQRMNGSWDAYLAPPADFAGVDDIITKIELGKGERAWDWGHRTHSLISSLHVFYMSCPRNLHVGFIFYSNNFHVNFTIH